MFDALDEYDSEGEHDRERDIGDILKMFVELKDLGDIRLRIFITSRPEIRNSMVVPTAIIRDVALHNAEGSEDDIGLFSRDELSDIGNRRCPGENWTALEQIQRLTKKAGKLFIYAATACRFVDEKLFYRKRLSMILEDDTTGMEELHKMYAQILEQSVPPGSEDREIPVPCVFEKHCRNDCRSFQSTFPERPPRSSPEKDCGKTGCIYQRIFI